MSFAVLVREKNQNLINYVRQLQRLTESFFEEFLEGFFPEVYEQVDLNCFIPLTETVLSELSDHRNRNIVVNQTKVDGVDTIIYVCIDAGNKETTDLSEQMYQLFSFLFQTYRMPIIPILVLQENTHWQDQEYKMSFPMEVLTFRYLTVQIQRQNWRKYLKKNNLVAAALLYQMDFPEGERVQLHIEISKMMLRIHGNPAENRLFYDFFLEDYFEDG